MSDTPESPQPEDANTSPSPASPAAPKAPAQPASPTPAAASPASPQKPATPAAPSRPAARPTPTPKVTFENLAEDGTPQSKDNFTSDEDDSPSKAGIVLDAVAAAVAIAFTALLLKDVLPFLS